MENEDMKAQGTANPVVVITGCSSRIGRVTAEYLSQRLCRVYPTARRDEEVAALRAAGVEGAMRLNVKELQ